ncbi:hypothetical protein BGV70_17795 [Burkholderia ubonensis]|nr:hypothetical protein WJ29_17470 [Burkholderia ubonensis]OJA65681.1 hypothetical protein BGV70_17795 [Burkholderia ubonensis]
MRPLVTSGSVERLRPAARTVLLTAAAMLAFASNSLLCRLALRDAQIDAASFGSLRLVSGALMLAIVVRRVRADAGRRRADVSRGRRVGRLFAARTRARRSARGDRRQLPARRADGAGPERGVRRARPPLCEKARTEPSAGFPSFRGDPAALAGAGASAQWPR